MRRIRLKWMRVLLAGALAMVLAWGSTAFANRNYTACPGCSIVASVDCVYINNTTHRWDGCPDPDCAYHDGTTESHGKSSVVSSTATCISGGTATYHCDACDSNFTESTGRDPSRHVNLAKTDRVEPTHTTYGRKEYWYCGYCNKYFSDAAGTLETTYAACYLPALGHDANLPWVITSTEHWKECSCGAQFLKNPHQPGLAATCVAPQRCLACGYQITPALGHDFETEFTVDVPNTCTTAGSKSQHCTRCWAKQNETVIPASHTPGQPATCTTGQLCAVCNQQISASLGHTDVIDPAVPATCTQTGLTAGSHCARCGDILVQQAVTSALGHTGVIDPAVPATCTQTGLTAGSHCSVCRDDLIPRTVIPALGHDFETEFTVDVLQTCTTAGSRSQHCTRCWAKQNETVIPASHTPGPVPNCSGGQFCIVCNYPLKPALPHTPVIDPAVPATYTQTGLTAGSHCSVCGAVITRQTAVSALGHDDRRDTARDVAPTCLAGGVKAYTCSRCNTASDVALLALGHTEAADAAVPATCTQTGLTAGGHCSVCGAVIVRQTAIPAVGHNYGTVRVVAPTCLKGGYTLMRCLNCGDEHKAGQTGSLGHLYGAWTPDGMGYHTALCERGCGHAIKAECTPVAMIFANGTVSVCPVCGGRFTDDSPAYSEAPLTVVAGAKTEALGNEVLPMLGDLIVRFWDAPFGIDSNVSRLYAIAFEHGGRPEDISGPVRVTIPIEGELPSFRLVFTDENGVETEIPYELAGGMLSFELSSAGILALITTD